MKSDSTSNDDNLPVYGEEADDLYTLEVFAELAGVETRTVLLYQKKGFIHPVSRDDHKIALFDTECLIKIRRIEQLRTTSNVNDTGLDLILSLLKEVEQLRKERRRIH